MYNSIHSRDTAEVWQSFWDVETSVLTWSFGGRGLSTAEMKSQETYGRNGWAGGDWVIDEGQDYPRLAWENTSGDAIAEPVIPFAGSGTGGDPYRINSVGDIQQLELK